VSIVDGSDMMGLHSSWNTMVEQHVLQC